MVERRDVEFTVEGGDRRPGWRFLASERLGKIPAISLAHGYAGVKEHGLERFAKAFTAGFIALVHDHRNFRRERRGRSMLTRIPFGARSPIGGARFLF